MSDPDQNKQKGALMRRFLIIGLLITLAGTAHAQQPSSQQKALSDKLVTELTENIQLRSALIDARAATAALQKELDDLKAKAKPEVKK